jgi:hypothetical protein
MEVSGHLHAPATLPPGKQIPIRWVPRAAGWAPEPVWMSWGRDKSLAPTGNQTPTRRSPLKVNRRFEGTYRLHLQGRRICRARNQHEAKLCLLHAGFLLDFFFKPEVGGDISFETSIDFQRTARCYIPEDRTLKKFKCLIMVHTNGTIKKKLRKDRMLNFIRACECRVYCTEVNLG